MRWEDEPYIKVYTRDSVDFIALGWEARSVLYELMRKVDRAGYLSLGKAVTGGHTASRAVTGVSAVLRMPEEVVGRALPVLLDDGCVSAVEGGLLLPNFIEAQASRSSDVARQRASREKARDMKRLSTTTGVIDGSEDSHTASHGVTRGHSPSHDVTLRVEESRLEKTRLDSLEGLGVRASAPLVGNAVQGCRPYAIGAFVDAISAVKGSRYVLPNGTRDHRPLFETMVAKSDLHDDSIVEWAREAGEGFARSGYPLDRFQFAKWLNDDRKPKAEMTTTNHKGRGIQPVDPGTYGERPWET